MIPPLNAAAWDETFAKYRHTPEYQKVNRGMALEEFKYIYYREYGHRILGRLAGLAFVVPLFVFLVRGALPRRRIPAFLGIGILFAVQGIVGWFMVKSGLVDQPQVSHYRLTLHLLCALALLGACLWLGFKYSFAVPPTGAPLSASPFFKKLALVFTGAVCLQITAGALTAACVRSLGGHMRHASRATDYWGWSACLPLVARGPREAVPTTPAPLVLFIFENRKAGKN